MNHYSREFADQPCVSATRNNMTQAARNLLTAVTRLLIVADMVDVHMIMHSLRRVSLVFTYLLANSFHAIIMTVVVVDAVFFKVALGFKVLTNENQIVLYVLEWSAVFRSFVSVFGFGHFFV